jgi:hypothetical protein
MAVVMWSRPPSVCGVPSATMCPAESRLSGRAEPGPVPGDGRGDGIGQRGASSSKRGLVFAGVKDEGLCLTDSGRYGLCLSLVGPGAESPTLGGR